MNSPGYPDSPGTPASAEAQSSPRSSLPNSKALSSSFSEAVSSIFSNIMVCVSTSC